ncbi:MAG: PEPxxWA-CTERM sorting domain-containing protein [Novosphingobium sp.]
MKLFAKAALVAGALIQAAIVVSPASAAVTLVDPSCSLVTGCKFSGNIHDASSALETQIAYNQAKNPDIVLNYLGSTDDGFGSVTGTPQGIWTLADFIVNYIAVKSGPAFMLYSIAIPGETGEYTTAGLQNGQNTNLPDLSHLAFFGARPTTAVPEPATWLMMILGFGAIASGMRRKTRAVRFA